MRQDLREGLALARECVHEDAKWLCGLFRDGAPESREQAWRVLSRQPKEDARAICFASLLRRSKSGLERAANMGNVLAQAVLGVSSSKQWFSGDSACQNDPNYMMAVVKYLHNEHRVKAIKLAKVAAAEWENPEAQEYYGSNGFKLSDPQRYYWYERAARNGNENVARIAIQDIPHQLQHYDKFGSGRIIFQIGEILEMTDVNLRYQTQTTDADIERVETLHAKWRDNAKEAIWCWSIVGKRNKIVKDIRHVISRMLWADRGAWSEESEEKQKTMQLSSP